MPCSKLHDSGEVRFQSFIWQLPSHSVGQGPKTKWVTHTSWGHSGDVPGDLVKGLLLFIYFTWRIITLIIS